VEENFIVRAVKKQCLQELCDFRKRLDKEKENTKSMKTVFKNLPAAILTLATLTLTACAGNVPQTPTASAIPSASAAPAEQKAYDYSSFIGAWYNGQNYELNITAANGNALTLKGNDMAEYDDIFIDGAYDVINNQISVSNEHTASTLIFTDDSIT
jgi:hypothetical protein